MLNRDKINDLITRVHNIETLVHVDVIDLNSYVFFSYFSRLPSVKTKKTKKHMVAVFIIGNNAL